jgi:hypothetical protein
MVRAAIPAQERSCLALSILSPPGQKILSANGFKPVTAPDAR